MSTDLAALGTLLRGISDADLEDLVGRSSFSRGAAYARQHRVRHLDVLNDSSLQATVVGSGGLYDTRVAFDDRAGYLEVDDDCSCPIGGECKHVVALILTARETLGLAGALSAPKPRAITPPVPAWQTVLAPMLAPRAVEAPTTPVGLLLEIQRPQPTRYAGQVEPAVRLTVRPVTPGKTGWVKNALSWRNLGYANAYGRVQVGSKELAALRACVPQHGSPYGYYQVGDRLELSDLGPGWLEALRGCARAGISLVTSARNSGRVVIATESTGLAADLTRTADSGLRFVPRLEIATDLAPTGPVEWFPIGAPPTGLWAMDGPDLLLTALDGSVDTAALRLLQHGPLEVPAADATTFLTGAVPLLSKRIRVASPDASVEIHEVQAPRLLLQLTHGPGVRLGLAWFFTYAVGQDLHRIPIEGDDLREVRDPAAEDALLGGLTALEQVPGLRHTPIGLPARPYAESSLTGFAIVTFLTQVLDELVATGTVDVEIVGDPVDYAEATEPPTIRLSVTESADTSDWFDLGVDVRVGCEQVPMADLVRALTLGEDHVILPTGTWFRIDRPELIELRDLIEEARAMQENPRGSLRLNPYQVDLWDQLEKLGVVETQSARWTTLVTGLTAAATGDPVEPVSVPDGLHATLRHYQHSGFEWLTFLRRHGLGGILADDMGLGKTMQTLAMVLTERAEEVGAAEVRGTPRPPWLVVAPTSVLAVWAAEAARFAPSLRVAVVGETTTRRGTPVASVAEGADLVVTSYAVFRLDAESFRDTAWTGLVLDEAQFVKNHQSQTYQCARTLEAPVKFAITGTPMENNLMELWSLLSIVAPGLFPKPTAFQEHYRKPIEAGTAPQRLDTLRRRIRPVMLRRTKEVVADDLPPKQEQILRVDLPPKHRRLYDRGLARERQRVLGLLDDAQRNRIAIFRSLTLLRQLSLHPGLVDPADAGAGSPKIEALVQMLGPIVQEGHQTLVFSQFTGFLAMVRARLDAEGISYAYLDGRTRKRQEAIDSFRSGTHRVFLISLKAGGFGLTLTEADYVFLLDPWWNPATEAQAVDRTHRIGQTKHVNVYRLVSTDTIEEKVLGLQERKRELFANVIDEGALAGGALSADDIRGLL